LAFISIIFHFILVFISTFIELKLENSKINFYIIFLLNYLPITFITGIGVYFCIYLWKFYNKKIEVDNKNLIESDENEKQTEKEK